MCSSIFAGLASTLPAAALAQSTFRHLGVLWGTDASSAAAISSSDQVVAGFSNTTSGSITRAFRWTEGDLMQDLGTVPPSSWAVGQAISRDGSTIAGRCGLTGFRWTSPCPRPSTSSTSRAFSTGSPRPSIEHLRPRRPQQLLRALQQLDDPRQR
jgi:probable HAF family extracellular repeat protein